MALQENLLKHLTLLLAEWVSLRQGNWYDQVHDTLHQQSCQWYLSATKSFINQYLSKNNGYYQSIEKLIKEERGWLLIHQTVWNIYESLKRLKSDIENWLLKWFESQISAEIFDTFLDHGKWYLDRWYKNEAWVIIWVVFEDTLRKFSRLVGINEKWEDLDKIISWLDWSWYITSIEAKRARSAWGVRIKATHAQWGEFTKEDVESALKFTQEFVSKMDSLI